MSSHKKQSPAPKVGGSRLPSHPQPNDPKHGEWLIDEASDESFPASDPSSVTQPSRKQAYASDAPISAPAP